MNKKVILIIMDGWGHGPQPERSAIAQAKTPFIDSLYKKYANTELVTHSEQVGLPEGQMGNSEVGHLNIGAGRIVYQELVRINVAFRNGDLNHNVALNQTFEYCLQNNKALHLMGLVSDGGVHSHINHLKSLCDLAGNKGLSKDRVFIHAFTDGRDCDPKSGVDFLTDLQNHLAHSTGQIASVCGRYYAMDRDNRWERVKLAYDMLTEGIGDKTEDIIGAINHNYATGITDEFIKPIVKVDADGKALATMKDGDAVICFNFRTDRCREITKALTQEDLVDFGMKKRNLHYTTMTVYDHKFKGIHSVFHNEDLKQTLGEVLEQNGKTQVRAAETEKYPHVTFFFSGGREQPFHGEVRLLAPSPKVATYDLQPEMSAPELTQKVLRELQEHQEDFFCINFANTDMVGHTGVFSAAVKAAETVDESVRQITELALSKDYTVLITADHGNADYMINDDGSPHTAHTMNPVPFFLVDHSFKPTLHSGKLGDIAPTILALMGIKKPIEMTGSCLF
ncbi:MAG: 2,3-bisphosphoglycerate-independent phosphoglycerate mutase [Bacteroidetes bacterium]|nr:2,3-bisphosphoglycerate-independent phosphoglycerate mutase [Bacteroidota bacterium]